MSQILSQDEVDALLNGLSNGDVETGQEVSVTAELHDVEVYDFASPKTIVRGRMPALDAINENFARMFRKTLSSTLRRIVGISTLSATFVKFDEFLKTLPVPSSQHVFKMPPLKGEMLFVVDSKLIFLLVDCLFGGTGRESFKVEGRDFTPIETNLIKKIVLSALSDLEGAWKTIVDANTVYQRSEINPQFSQIVGQSEVVAVVKYEVVLEYSSGMIMVCVPYASLEQIRDKLKGRYHADELEHDKEWTNRFRRGLQQSTVEMVVELGKTELTGLEVITMKRGDVIPLDQYVDGSLNVYIENELKFTGHPGFYRGNRAIRISEILINKNEEVEDNE